MTYRSPIRDLIVRIDTAIYGHIAGPQVSQAIGHLRDHLSMMARIEEINQAENKPQASNASGEQFRR